MENKKNLILFVILSMTVLFLWDHYFAPQLPEPTAIVADKTQPDSKPQENRLTVGGQRVTVKTDLLSVELDTTGGDIRYVELLKHQGNADSSKNFVLLNDKNQHVYVAQSGLLLPGLPDSLPNHTTIFSTDKSSYVMDADTDTLTVKMSAPKVNGIEVNKYFEFKKGAYYISVRHEIINQSSISISPTAYFRLLRDDSAIDGKSYFDNTYNGPAMYSDVDGSKIFQKIPFTDIRKQSAKFNSTPRDGWIGMVQHYFASAWLMSSTVGGDHALVDVCASAEACVVEMKEQQGDSDNLFSAAVKIAMPSIPINETANIALPLYVGPIDHAANQVSEGLVLAKDFGIFYIFASPLFWLMDKLHQLVGNWGWAIVLLTIALKLIFFPLTAASYRSMAKMRLLAPRMATLKEQYGDDRLKFQQAVMDMYKREKVNPMGGCLPILIQIPVFMGLYWSLLASVELRGAPWILWIQDLARPDPYYILPVIMAITMIVQSFLNPPPSDPMQAKMMKIMPIIFSVMFFFFASGLVLYWIVNNILSIIQQQYINRSTESAEKKTHFDKPRAEIHGKHGDHADHKKD